MSVFASGLAISTPVAADEEPVATEEECPLLPPEDVNANEEDQGNLVTWALPPDWGLEPDPFNATLLGFNISRSVLTNPAEVIPAVIDFVDATTFSFLDLDVIDGEAYAYFVTAVYDCGDSLPGGPAIVGLILDCHPFRPPWPVPPPPLPPRGDPQDPHTWWVHDECIQPEFQTVPEDPLSRLPGLIEEYLPDCNPNLCLDPGHIVVCNSLICISLGDLDQCVLQFCPVLGHLDDVSVPRNATDLEGIP